MYLSTLKLMNLESLVSARIHECKQAARKFPATADIHLENVPMYEELGAELRAEIDTRFDAIRNENGGAILTGKLA